MRGILKDAVKLPADCKPLAMGLRETSILSLTEAFRSPSMHLDGFWTWCTGQPKQAIKPQLYLSHLKFLLMASGEHFQTSSQLADMWQNEVLAVVTSSNPACSTPISAQWMLRD